MKYRFIGKPDKIFPYLKTGKVYDLVVKEKQAKFLCFLIGKPFPVIYKPIECPYSSWATFRQNWKRI
jgi:hypothetical protein